MNPTTMDDTVKKFWELTHREILTQTELFLRNCRGGGGRVYGGGGDGGGRMDGGGGGDDDGSDRVCGGGDVGGNFFCKDGRACLWLGSIGNIKYAMLC